MSLCVYKQIVRATVPQPLAQRFQNNTIQLELLLAVLGTRLVGIQQKEVAIGVMLDHKVCLLLLLLRQLVVLLLRDDLRFAQVVAQRELAVEQREHDEAVT